LANASRLKYGGRSGVLLLIQKRNATTNAMVKTPAAIAQQRLHFSDCAVRLRDQPG
jgi:hypothetical protein